MWIAYRHSFLIDTNSPETNTLFMNSYENNYGVVADNHFSSMLTDEHIMGFPNEKAKDMPLTTQTPHTDTHQRNTSLRAQPSHPQLRQECHDSSSIPQLCQNTLSKGQDRIMPIQWSTPSIISLTFYSLLNTVFDVRSRRDCLLASIESYSNDSNRSSPADLSTILQSISAFSRLVEPYLTSLESKISTSAVSSESTRSLQCEQTTFHLLVATSTFILDILRIVSENHGIFLGEALENGNANQQPISPSKTSSTSESTPSQLTIHLTDNDISHRLNLIIHFTTIDYYAFRWQRSLAQITNLLGDDSEDEATPKELTDARAHVNAFRNDLTAAIDMLRTPGNHGI